MHGLDEAGLTSRQGCLVFWLIAQNVYIWPMSNDEGILIRERVYPWNHQPRSRVTASPVGAETYTRYLGRWVLYVAILTFAAPWPISKKRVNTCKCRQAFDRP